MEKEHDFYEESIDPKFILWRMLFWLFILVFVLYMLEQEKSINLERSKKEATINDTLNTNINND